MPKPWLTQAAQTYWRLRSWPYLGVVRLLVLVSVTLSAVVLWRIAVSRSTELTETRTLATNLTRMLAEETEATVQIADTILLGWTERLNGAGGMPAAAPLSPIGAAGLIGSLDVYDDTGAPVPGGHSGAAQPGSVDPAQLAFHRGHPEGAVFIGLATVRAGEPGVTIALSRPLSGPDGRFAGVVVATLDPARVIRTFETVDPGPRGRVVLAHESGVLLLRRPFVPDTEGHSFAASPMFRDRLPRAPAGWLETASPVDGQRQIVAYQRVGATPLVVLVALSKDDALADWRVQTGFELAALAGSLLLISLLCRRLIGQIHAQLDSYAKLADVEARLRQANDATEEANRLLILAEEIGHIGHWRLDVPTGLVTWSDETYRIHGFPRAPAHPLGQSIAYYHPDDRGEIVQKLDAAVKTGAEFTFEVRLLQPEGAVRDVRGVGRAERDVHGQVISVFGIVQDVTAQREADREVRRLNLRMTRANHAAKIGVWDWHLPTGALAWNAQMYRIYGFASDTPLTFDAWSGALHPEDRDRAVREIMAAVDTATPFDSKFRVIWPNGAVRYVQAAAELLHDGAGAPLHMVGTNADVTEIETVSARLLAEQEQLRDTVTQWTLAKNAAEDASRAKSEFLTSMSHELRTPMNGVLGFTQLLQGQYFGPLNATQAGYVASILSSGKHLLKLIEDVLDLSKVESGKLSISPEEVELTPVVRAVIATLQSTGNESSVTVDGGDHALGFPTILADRTRLAQALINLGSNAVKYNRPGGSVIFSYARPAPGWVRLAVTDTGIGIPAGRQQELFQPFNRLGAEQRAIDGTGIGLSLTRRMVELMGGRVGFRSTEGEGSCFWVDMPEFVAPSLPASTRLPVVPPAFALSPAGYSILYVEDNPLNRSLLRGAVGTLPGVSLIEAATGETGWSMAQTHRPDIIILDVNLPDMTGFALLHRLKRQPHFANTPILALTANAMPGDMRRGAGAGFFHYMTKPLDIDDLFAVLGRAIQSIPVLELDPVAE